MQDQTGRDSPALLPRCGVGDIEAIRAISVIAPTATFVEDWDGYHVHDGEVHCATTAVRTLETGWFQRMPLSLP